MAFESLSEKLQGVINKLRGKTRVTEEDVKEIAREVKLALMEARKHWGKMFLRV